MIWPATHARPRGTLSARHRTAGSDASTTRSRRRVRAHARPSALRLRARRIPVFTALILVADLGVSFWGAVAGPSNVSFGVRAVEWLRDNGAAGAVSEVESVYYSLNAPSTGGPALKRLPRVGTRARVRARATRRRRSTP